MSNSSSITQFLLLAFAEKRELQLLTFWLFLGIYLAALLGNSIIITAVACNHHHLHTPLYFFLLNLSILDLGFISTTLPKSMANSFWDFRTISYSGCAAQLFFFAFLISSEFLLLTVMAYDRYVAICKPLHYGTLLGSRACAHMAAAAWGSGFLNAVLHTANTFSLPLCQGNALDQLFCEIPQILKLSCSHTYLREVGLLVFSAFVFWWCFVFIVLSYVQIFRAVLRIPSEQGRHKAFSNISHQLLFPQWSQLLHIIFFLTLPDLLRLGQTCCYLHELMEKMADGDGNDYTRPPDYLSTHAPRQQMSNSSSIAQFLLLAFADTRELQLLHFWLFLGIYLAALLGNDLIITIVACDHRLHTPMYFFFLNLSVSDLGFISTTLPKSMANSLWDSRTISYSGCSAQLFFFGFLMSSEFFLLTIMAYDRYVAICKPLHYGTLLGSRACANMAAAAWGSGFLTAVLHTANTFSLPLCQGNALDQFFCEIPQILKLSCSHTHLREVGLLIFNAFVFWWCFVFIVLSYVQILRAVLRIPSEQGRHKAFSTCLPHLAVVSLFISTGTFAYLKPPSMSSPFLDLVVAVLYSVAPPALNPLIYSMRNQELKESIRKVISGMVLKSGKFSITLQK
ncbi:uncharacterized protein FYN12_014561 [Phoenicopterus ruber ruber]